MAKRRTVRESREIAIQDMRFRRVVERGRSTTRVPATPNIVVLDLRRGNLASLDEYLRLNKGIPDRRVALELRKLLSRTKSRSKYQLVAIERPRHPGRPEKPFGDAPSPTQLTQADLYRKYREAGDQVQYAAENAARDCGTSPGAILRSEKVLAEFESEERRILSDRMAREERRADLVKSRNKALEKLRKEQSKGR